MDGIFLTLPIVIIGLLLFLYFVPLGLWIQSGVSIGWGKIGMVKLVIMRIRKIPPKLMADGIINLHRAGLDFVSSEEVQKYVRMEAQTDQMMEMQRTQTAMINQLLGSLGGGGNVPNIPSGCPQQ